MQKADDASVGYVSWLISAADAQACSLTDADRSLTVDGMYWAVPNVTHVRMTEFAEAKAAEAAMRAGETPTRVSRAVRDVQKSVRKEKAAQEAEQALQSACKRARRAELPRTISSLQEMILEKDDIIDDALEKIDALEEELAMYVAQSAEAAPKLSRLQLLESQVMNGLNRYNIFDSAFHKVHKGAARHLVGFQSWAEYCIYFKCFWPHVPVDYKLKKSKRLSKFMKLTMVKILFTRGYAHATLALLFDVGESAVSKCVNKYKHWWGEVGLQLSILSITPEFIADNVKAEFRAEGLANAGFGCDGKDFGIEDINTNSMLKRSCYSDKISSGDTIRYPNLNGMITPPFLSGRPQFNRREVLASKSPKKLRWKEEGVFARVTDEAILQDRVAYHNISVLEHAWNWGLARSNLGQPFYKPPNYKL